MAKMGTDPGNLFKKFDKDNSAMCKFENDNIFSELGRNSRVYEELASTFLHQGRNLDAPQLSGYR